MIAAEAVPLFERDFGLFLNDDATPTLISPKRFGQVLCIDMLTLAAKARVHQSTISHAPGMESLQRYLRESLRILRASTDVAGSVEKAIFWFKNNPLPAFDYKTPQDVISEGHTEALIRYIRSLHVGFAG
jgi:hypothetical protein